MKLNIATVPEVLRFAVGEVMRRYPGRFASDGTPVDISLEASMTPGACRAEVSDGRISIAAGGKTGALRALGRVMGAAVGGTVEGFEEAPFTTTFGIMPDCSRNAVPNVVALKELILKTSLMGLNSMMLYVEDTFPVEGEPFFGYLRGGYTKAQLKEADDYADAFGVELFPCIEGLGHMEQFLQWQAAAKYRDTDRVLCAFLDDTYELLDKCIASVSECFRSRRINLGMDEAWGLGTGEFRKKFGEHPTGEIMNGHLSRVRELCRKHGLRPMIWSDMYFRIGSKTHAYYDPEWSLDAETISKIPRDVALCYWDYYHTDRKEYERYMEFHKRLGCDIVFAGGAWTWGRLWNSLAYSIKLADNAFSACRRKDVREVFITLWGDDGAECDVATALPAIQHAAECVYSPTGKVSKRIRAANLRGSCDLVFADWEAADLVNTNQYFHDLAGCPSGAEKAFFWEDPALALFDPQTPDDPALNEFYAKLARRLLRAAKRTPESAYLAFQGHVAKALSYKFGLRGRIRKAVLAGDHAGAEALATNGLLALKREVDKAWEIRRERWMTHNSPFGWEVLEARFAAQSARAGMLAARVKAWVRGELDSLPEFEAELHPMTTGGDPSVVLSGGYARLKTPSCIK